MSPASIIAVHVPFSLIKDPLKHRVFEITSPLRCLLDKYNSYWLTATSRLLIQQSTRSFQVLLPASSQPITKGTRH
jgi:hypothetical protein